MPSILSAIANPAGTVTAATECIALNIPTNMELHLPPLSPPWVIVRGCVWVTTAASTTALSVRLRVGYGQVAGPLVGNTITIPAIASILCAVPFHFIDSTLVDMAGSGYTLTIQATGPSANGTVTAVTYEIDYSIA